MRQGSHRPVFAVVNPVSAGGATRRRWPQIREALVSLGFHVEHTFTQAPGHATELAREGVRNGFPLLLVVGGDGTLNEVVNGVAVEDFRATLAVVPSGTGQDLSRNLGLPQTWEAALARLRSPSRVAVDVGCLTFESGQRRYFVNAAGAGLDAEVALRARRLTFLGRGALPYVLALVAYLATYRPREMTLTVGPDGTPQRFRAALVLLANGPALAGNMRVAPKAVLDDGALDAVVIGDVGRLELLWNLPSVFRGAHLGHPKVRTFRARRFLLSGPPDTRVEADGEIVGGLPVQADLLPQALRLLH
ncbi:MAG TPA: diacylglycerol kinase family protein [Chloroflexota bacterium]